MVGDLDASSSVDFSGFVLPDSKDHGAIGANATPGIADIVQRGAEAIEEGGDAHGGFGVVFACSAKRRQSLIDGGRGDSTGRIEMIVCELANTGTSAAPSVIGTIGIAAGGTRASELRLVKPVQFGRLKGYGAVYMPFGRESAIYEQFYSGTGDTCPRGRDALDES